MSAQEFWRGKNVLLTGHSGFKGSWLAIWLNTMGAKVTGVSLPPDTAPNLFDLAKVNELVDNHFLDIREFEKLEKLIHDVSPDIVIHMAAQALVRKSYADPLNTFSTNIQGTANVLQAIRGCQTVKVALMITTDKVYADNGGQAYSETDPLGGHDPYSASKAASEIVIDSYRKSFLSEQGVAVATARAGNVIGGGDWSPDRLLPDAIRAWQNTDTLSIRMPEAVRPWQHVLEPLYGYLQLITALWETPALAEAYNFGPLAKHALSVREIVEAARSSFGAGKVEYGESDNKLHEAEYLRLDTTKVRHVIGLQSDMSVHDAVAKAMHWYRQQLDGVDARQLCLNDIAEFENSL